MSAKGRTSGSCLPLITHHAKDMSFHLQPSSVKEKAPDAAAEAERLAALLEERRAGLSALQEEFREFKERYARTVGGRLAELAEVEADIRRAEARPARLQEDEEGGGSRPHFQ